MMESFLKHIHVVLSPKEVAVPSRNQNTLAEMQPDVNIGIYGIAEFQGEKWPAEDCRAPRNGAVSE